MITDTIAAISTPPGTGGVGIIRISGPDSLAIANKIFDRELSESHKIVYGRVVCEGGAGVIDEALACYFKSPSSYTGEDVVELYCHGGTVVCKMVLECALKNGAVLAEAGEFTKRAFLNGKIDLTRAEAVADIISAKTQTAVLTAAGQLSGILADKIKTLRGGLLEISAHIMAGLDFSEEVDEMPRDTMKERLVSTLCEINALLDTADDGRIIKDGINAVIIGSANVGKSSFLNAVSGEDRVIVTSTEGTTRDTVEVSVNIRGCLVNLIDTAGIRETGDEAERLGVERSVKAVENADIILLMLDGSRPLNQNDKAVIDLVRGKNVICLVNKSDLPQRIDDLEFNRIFHISALTGEGLDRLFTEISDRYKRGGLVSGAVITSPRQKQALIKAKGYLESAISAVDGGVPSDIIMGELELCLSALGEIDGMTVSDEIIDEIFSAFCVGK
ncbi:MAG: tRNA modification GTPase MnmE [Firmicutes bacterium ADurb.Bin193]|nr:MAG: tRNA modification GTPase MnmE [Firmicutes bacterium ADurb.Bin193]